MGVENNINVKFCQNMIEWLSLSQDVIQRAGGVDGLIAEIRRYAENCDNTQKRELEIKILVYTSEEFGITTDNILYSPKRGDVVAARKLCFVIFKEQLGMSEYAIAKYFNRSDPIVNRAVHEFEKYEGKVKEEKKILAAYRNIVEKLEKYKEDSNYNKQTNCNINQ